MLDAGNSDYYRLRADQERERAERSTQPEVKRVHQEMADRYAAVARTALAEPRDPALHWAG